MSVAIIIRQESTNDYNAVDELIREAFENEIHSDHQEQFLVARLRKSEGFIPAFSLVATVENMIVGYILLTPIQIEKDNKIVAHSLALAPVAVLKTYQGKGIGVN